jgi:CRISPR system Cascade subunit CasE
MLYLSRLMVQASRIASGWLANPYRVHQRLKMACPEDARLLFRIEDGDPLTRILAQSHTLPDWAAAFNQFTVLQGLPEMKTFEPEVAAGQLYAFRLEGNATVKREGKRLGLLTEEDQNAWLARHLAAAGAEILRIQIQPYRIQHSQKSGEGESEIRHLLVQFDGLLVCREAGKLSAALEQGVGPAKGFGCGLLSLARA